MYRRSDTRSAMSTHISQFTILIWILESAFLHPGPKTLGALQPAPVPPGV